MKTLVYPCFLPEIYMINSCCCCWRGKREVMTLSVQYRCGAYCVIQLVVLLGGSYHSNMYHTLCWHYSYSYFISSTFLIIGPEHFSHTKNLIPAFAQISSTPLYANITTVLLCYPPASSPHCHLCNHLLYHCGLFVCGFVDRPQFSPLKHYSPLPYGLCC